MKYMKILQDSKNYMLTISVKKKQLLVLDISAPHNVNRTSIHIKSKLEFFLKSFYEC